MVGRAVERLDFRRTIERVRGMYLAAFHRPPTEAERAACLEYVGSRTDAETWAELAHSLFNVKEFIYIR